MKEYTYEFVTDHDSALGEFEHYCAHRLGNGKKVTVKFTVTDAESEEMPTVACYTKGKQTVTE